jgi:N-acetylmuramoyl-L-alanine amidase
MRRVVLILVLLPFLVGSATAQRTDLSGLFFCVDPGHGGHNPANDRRIEPDPGIVFWESESNFQKALLLDTLLQQQGAAVILTRYTNDYPNDADEPTLTQRWQLANANNVDWFHSIHSNAFNGVTNYTLVLLKEDIATRQPAFPQALTMSNIMSPRIRAKLRTSSSSVALDYTFYGGSNGGFNLGVLRGLTMPGELSEGSFHDVFPETRRLLNNHYRKMEAYALRNSIMQYYSVPADTLGIVAGIQTEIGTARPLNEARVRLLPEDIVFDGDTFNNGFFMFDQLVPGQKTVRFETPDYTVDSALVTVGTGATVFADKMLESVFPPRVTSTVPVEGDTLFSAARSLSFQFSKVMDTASVRNAFSITPPVSGTFSWSKNNTSMVFDPDSVLPFYVYFALRIDTTAQSAGGQSLDGDGDGVSGDPFVLTFRTRDVDAFAPVILARYPSADATLPSPTSVLNVTFDEFLDQATVSLTNIVVQKVGGSILPRTLQYWESGIKGGVNIYLASALEPGASYRMRVSGLADVVGNAVPVSDPASLWQFSVSPTTFAYAPVEPFDSSLVNWFQPGASGSTTGIDSAFFMFDANSGVPGIDPNLGAARLRYYWNTSASDWLIREYLSSGAPRSVLFQRQKTILQVYVLGDGSGNQFRFAVDDSVDVFPGGTATNHEVSRWYPIDWIGWRLVEWDLENDSVGSWIGNGILEGQLRFDSFQLRYLPGAASPSGSIVFDQLQIATQSVTSVNTGGEGVPRAVELQQNFPNPFNPTTTIRFSLPEAAVVRLEIYDILGRAVTTLVDDVIGAGTHSVMWNARSSSGAEVSSGMYFARFTATDPRGRLMYNGTIKLLLMK